MIAITGATGQTGSKVAGLLLKKGIKIRVLGRSGEKLKYFKELGAEVAVGDQADSAFLTGAFSGCDAAYLLIPPKFDTTDFRAYYNQLGSAAVTAIRESGLKKVVFLSSLGAELSGGTGPVVGLHDIELKLRQLTETDVAILRPAYFMENTLWNIPLIKQMKINGNSVPPEVPFAVISTRDIAEKAAELLESPLFLGQIIIELFGDRISYGDITQLIGTAIGIPNLPYVKFTDEDVVKSMKESGLSDNMARSFVELSSAIARELVHPLQIDPLFPNTKTTFREFAETIFKPAYTGAL